MLWVRSIRGHSDDHINIFIASSRLISMARQWEDTVERDSNEQVELKLGKLVDKNKILQK